jgi:sugar phosphate isomerase/epimerase
MSEFNIVTSVAPYVTAANAFQAMQLAHEDGFSGIELNEDHLNALLEVKPNCLALMREFGAERRMTNSVHKTLHRPSIDSDLESERKKAVDYTLKTLDHMEAAGVSRMVLHSFSDLPGFFTLRNERANASGYLVGSNVVKIYGVLAPVLKAYRKLRNETIERNFMRSLDEIARYAADKKANGKPLEIVLEEHYSDAINYDRIGYGRGSLHNVIRGVDTAHHLIRTGENVDLADASGPIHFHAADTNGTIDDHRAIGTGKVNFKNGLESLAEKRLTDGIVVEVATRKSALESRAALASLIKRISMVTS